MESPRRFFTDVNFNSETIWTDIQGSIADLCSHLKETKLGEDLKSILSQIEKSRKSQGENFRAVLFLIQSAVKENKAEETNILFINFFRLASIFLFLSHDREKAHDFLDLFIGRIDSRLKGIEEEFQDKNLLIERDKMLLGKAQFYFWEGKFDRANQIINNRLEYFISQSVDEFYMIKMTYFYVNILCYKAWICLHESDQIEADKCFFLASKLLKDLKNKLIANFPTVGLCELYRRQVKVYDQYFNFMLCKVNQTNMRGRDRFYHEEFNEESDFTRVAFKFVKEILKILSKPDFEFDAEIPTSLLIYYNSVAAYFSLIFLDPKGRINLESTIYYMLQAYVASNKFDFRESQGVNAILVWNIYEIVEAISSLHSKQLQVSDENGPTEKLLLGLASRQKEIMLVFEEDHKVTVSDEQTLSEVIAGLKYPRNLLIDNIEKFSPEFQKKSIKDTIDEIFVIKSIADRFNNVLASTMMDDSRLDLSEEDLVIESLNGFLVLKDNSITLVIHHSFLKNCEGIFGMKIGNMLDSDQRADHLVLSVLELKSSEQYYVYFSKYDFKVNPDSRFDVAGYLVLVNYFYVRELYRPAVVLISHLLREFEAIPFLFSGKKDEYTDAYFEMYVFLVYLKAYLTFKLEDFGLVFGSLMNTSQSGSEYNRLIYNLLVAVVFAKEKYMDLSAVYFDKALGMVESCVQIETLHSGGSADKNIVNLELIDTCYVPAVKMIVSAANIMKLKAIMNFIKKIDLEAEDYLDELEGSEKGNQAYFETIVKNKVCFTCGFIEGEADEKKKAHVLFNCTKCRRAAYCSIRCMQKDMRNHSIICGKYFKNFEKVNQLIGNYVANFKS